MNSLDKYVIRLLNLKNKDYTFDFEVNSSFFENYENKLLEKGDFKVKVLLDKSETMLQFTFIIEGTAVLVCDRSLEEFDYPLSSKEKMIFKVGDHNEQINEELEMISRNSVEINIAQYIYEYISIALPMKRLHPRFQEEDDDADEMVLIYSSKETETDEDAENEGDQEDIDPRWQALKKFKN